MTKVRRFMLAALTAAMLLVPTAAFADPPHGAGSSSAGPNDANAHCHPYGQNSDDPRCK